MFNRTKYDGCAARTAFEENVSLFSHTMDVSRFVHSAPCRHEAGLAAGNRVSTIGPQPTPSTTQEAWGDMVALENDLRGQTRPVTRCPEYDYRPQQGVITAREIYKPVVHPDIRTDALKDLPSCQMIDFSNTAHT